MLALLNDGSAELPHEEWNELRPQIDSALASLPALQRNTLVLRVMLRKSTHEVAAELKCSEKLVSVRLSRALESLRQALRRRGVEVGCATLSAVLEKQMTAAVPQSAQLAIMAAAKAAFAGTTAGVAGGISGMLRCKATLGLSGFLAASALFFVLYLPGYVFKLQRVLEQEFNTTSRKTATEYQGERHEIARDRSGLG
jgi:hypothetical protein